MHACAVSFACESLQPSQVSHLTANITQLEPSLSVQGYSFKVVSAKHLVSEADAAVLQLSTRKERLDLLAKLKSHAEAAEGVEKDANDDGLPTKAPLQVCASLTAAAIPAWSWTTVTKLCVLPGVLCTPKSMFVTSILSSAAIHHLCLWH